MLFIPPDKKRYAHRHGFTLTELALVLGVIGFILAAIWVAGSPINEKANENNAATELQIVVQNITSMMQGRNFTNMTPSTTAPCSEGTANGIATITKAMLTAQTIPNTYVDSGNNCLADNPWTSNNGRLVVGKYTASNQKFNLQFTNTTNAGCVSLLLRATACQAGQLGCPLQVNTNGKNSTSCTLGTNCAVPSATTGWQTLTPTAATTLCNANAANGGSVSFDYSL